MNTLGCLQSLLLLKEVFFFKSTCNVDRSSVATYAFLTGEDQSAWAYACMHELFVHVHVYCCSTVLCRYALGQTNFSVALYLGVCRIWSCTTQGTCSEVSSSIWIHLLYNCWHSLSEQSDSAVNISEGSVSHINCGRSTLLKRVVSLAQQCVTIHAKITRSLRVLQSGVFPDYEVVIQICLMLMCLVYI